MTAVLYTGRTTQLKFALLSPTGDTWIQPDDKVPSDEIMITRETTRQLGLPDIRQGDLFYMSLTLYGTIDGVETAIPYNDVAYTADAVSCVCVLYDPLTGLSVDQWICNITPGTIEAPFPGLISIYPETDYIIDTAPGTYRFALQKTGASGMPTGVYTIASGWIEISKAVP